MVKGGLRPPSQEEEVQARENSKRGVIYILENASLEAAKVGKDHHLLNCDDHANFLRRHGKDPAQYRPDICHQALYVHTAKNVLIQINPQVRLPRTFKRFCGLLVQLLQKLSIRATNGPDKLLKVIKGPVTMHLPPNSLRVGFTRTAPDVVKLHDFVATLPKDATPVFVVGAMAHGKVEVAYVDRWISVSQYPLSAAYCLGRTTNALEMHWNIL